MTSGSVRNAGRSEHAKDESGTKENAVDTTAGPV